MATTTNFGWTTPNDTDLVKNGAAAIRTLGSAVDTSLAQLKGGTTGQVLSKTSNTDMAFTWVAQDDSNAIQNALLTTTGDTIYASSASTPARLAIGSSGQALTVVAGVPSWAASATSVLTTTGDLLYASAANTLARRAIGTTGQVLTVSGGVPTWATPASGGGYTLINTGGTALSGTSITISSIPNTYKFLYLVVVEAYTSAADSLELRLNGDTSASNYRYANINNRDNSITGTKGDTQDNIKLSNSIGNSSDDNKRMYGVATFTNYTGTSGVGVAGQFYAFDTSIPATTSTLSNGVYNNSAAITSITLRTGSGNSFSGGTAYLYGVN